MADRTAVTPERRYVFEHVVNVVHFAVATTEGACSCGCGRGLVTYCRGMNVGSECTVEVAQDAADDRWLTICAICQQAARERHSRDADWPNRNLKILRVLIEQNG